MEYVLSVIYMCVCVFWTVDQTKKTFADVAVMSGNLGLFVLFSEILLNN